MNLELFVWIFLVAALCAAGLGYLFFYLFKNPDFFLTFNVFGSLVAAVLGKKKKDESEPLVLSSTKELFLSGILFLALIAIVGASTFLFDIHVLLRITIVLLFIGVCIPYILYGLKQIEVQHAGIVLFLGKPLSGLLFENGLYWVPRGIIDIEQIDLREQTDEIAEYTFLVQDSKHEDITGAGVEYKISVSVQWRVVDPLKIIKTDPDVISRGMHLAIIDGVRDASVQHKPIEFINEGDSIKLHVAKKVKVNTNRWGAEILAILVPMIDFADEKIQDAYNAKLREQQERDAEKVELDFVFNEIKSKHQLLEGSIPQEEISRIIQVERGKMTRKETIISHKGEKPDMLTAAAAILKGGE